MPVSLPHKKNINKQLYTNENFSKKVIDIRKEQ